MSDLMPTDDGVRRFRPGPLLIFLAVGLLSFLVIAVVSILNKPAPEPKSPPPLASQIEAEIRQSPPPTNRPTPVPEEVEPAYPDHALVGLRRIYLADGSLHRYRELTFARGLATQHSHPVAVLRTEDPCLWNFQPVSGQKETYRIICADDRFPEISGKNLTYTRVIEDPLMGDAHPSDELSPHLTLRDDDPCFWEVRKTSYSGQFELYCQSGVAPWIGKSLGWADDLEDLPEDLAAATLNRNGNPSWWISPPEEELRLPPRATHLIVVPTSEIDEALVEKSKSHVEEADKSILQVRFIIGQDDYLRKASSLSGRSYREFLQRLPPSDPILKHPLLPGGIVTDPLEILDRLAEGGNADEGSLFPLVIPFEIGLPAHQIEEFHFENVRFWKNDWESYEQFQEQLDESPASDGRVFTGKEFTYFFVRLP